MSKKRESHETAGEAPHYDKKGRATGTWLSTALGMSDRHERCLVTSPRIFLQDSRDTAYLNEW